MTTRRRYIYVEGRGMVEVSPDYVAPRRKAPAIQGVKEPFYSHADGLWYTDQRTYERHARALGFELVGNERDPKYWGERPKMPPVEEDLKRSAQELGMDL